jgi:DNA topoisomerase-2
VQSVIANELIKVIRKSGRGFKDVKPHELKPTFGIFINCQIEEPDFDTQSKECLTSPSSSFGSNFTLPKTFTNDLMHNTTIIDDILTRLSKKDSSLLGSSLKKLRTNNLTIPKLDDANLAGTKDSANKCTLILTEGDSAKALAVSGLSVLGRDYYGVFPLRGKVLNVRDVSSKILAKNVEIKNIVQILGLDFKKKYNSESDLASLRYGGVMVMADQDNDGSHIKGLLINMFRVLWPELLRLKPSFVSQFVTPIVKAKWKDDVVTFYSQSEYVNWCATNPDAARYKIKYYKGLGTSTSVEGKEYFQNLDDHLKKFCWVDEEDGEAVDKAFDKSRAEDRREWILDNYDGNRVPEFEKEVRYKDFVDEELINYSNADNVRSLPCVIDGLKPSQRKVLFGCFKRKLRSEVKVAQLAGYIAEQTAYHHGEQSLYATIVGMAQDFVGSNNLPLLSPNGQFGTRLSGGKDSASPRYIFTELQKTSRKVFPELDDGLLNTKYDDGQAIEPEFFVPVIPLLLVNGSSGIGTGWSTSIPQHNPRDVIKALRAMIEGEQSGDVEEKFPIAPYFEGFKGEIREELTAKKRDGEEQKPGFISTGIVKKLNSREIEISELPVGKWTSDYKNHLIQMQLDGSIKSFTEHHTTTSVRFVVQAKQKNMAVLMKNPTQTFKLESRISLNNMNAFSASGEIVKYDSAHHILRDFYPVRLELYKMRKEDLERRMEHSVRLIGNRTKFIEKVVLGEIEIFRGEKTKEEIVQLLDELGFDRKGVLDGILGAEREDSAEEDSLHDSLKAFDYLLSTQVSQFTRDKIESLVRDKVAQEEALEALRCTTKERMWLDDLDELEAVL